MMKMGPNDVSDASFGPKVCLLFFLRVLLISFVYLGSIRAIKRRGGLGWTAMRETGPNDTSDASFGP